jgi:hypothetical protein
MDEACTNRLDSGTVIGVGEWSAMNQDPLVDTVSAGSTQSVGALSQVRHQTPAKPRKGDTEQPEVMMAWVNNHIKTSSGRLLDSSLEPVPGPSSMVPPLSQGYSVADTESTISTEPYFQLAPHSLINPSVYQRVSQPVTLPPQQTSPRDSQLSIPQFNDYCADHESDSDTSNSSSLADGNSTSCRTSTRETTPTARPNAGPVPDIDDDSLSSTSASSQSDWDGSLPEHPHHPRSAFNFHDAGIDTHRHEADSPSYDGHGSDQNDLAGDHGTPDFNSNLRSATSTNRNRKRRAWGDDFESSEGGQKRLRGRAKASAEDATPRKRLACPFFKKDPTRYNGCYEKKLTKISYVKQHLERSHSQPIHCVFCMEVFLTEDECRIHERDRSCEIREYVEPDGVSPKKKEMLKRRADQKKAEDDQWYDIFGVLFPDSPKPSSPYIYDSHSEDLTNYHEFQATRGSEMLTSSLFDDLTRTANLTIDKAAFDELVRQALDGIWDRWRQLRRIEPDERERELSRPTIEITAAPEDQDQRRLSVSTRRDMHADSEDDRLAPFYPTTPQSMPEVQDFQTYHLQTALNVISMTPKSGFEGTIVEIQFQDTQTFKQLHIDSSPHFQVSFNNEKCSPTMVKTLPPSGYSIRVQVPHSKELRASPETTVLVCVWTDEMLRSAMPAAFAGTFKILA